MSKGSKVKAPDYYGLASQQGDINQQAARQTATLNRPNVATPMGSSTWSKQGNQFTNTVNYAPGTQELVQALQGSGGRIGASTLPDLGQQISGNLGSPMDTSGITQVPGAMNIDTSGLKAGPDALAAERKAVSDAMYGQATQYMGDQFGRQEDSLRTRLANQGLDQSSAAHGNAMRDFYRAENDAYANARNQSILAGQNAVNQDQGTLASNLGQMASIGGQQFNQGLQGHQTQLADMLQLRDQPLMEYQSLASALSPMIPDFSGVGSVGAGVTPADYIGAGNSAYQSAIDAKNAGTAGTAATIGGGASLTSALANLYKAFGNG